MTIKMRLNRSSARRALLLGLGVAMAVPGTAAAIDFTMGPVAASFDSTLSTGFQARVEGRDCSIIGNDNGGCVPTSSELQARMGGGALANPDINYLNADSGNLNYDQGDVTSWVIKGTHELALRGQDGWSGLVRGTWSGDLAADHTDRTPLETEAKNIVNADAELLDAWVAKSFSWLGGQNAKVKLGNQVLSWGEDIFIPGGINTINAIDFRKAHIPGTQVKEILKPAPMVSLSTGLTRNLSGEAYYQFLWNAHTFDPVGTFFSVSDVVGPGRRAFYLPSSAMGAGFGDEGTNRATASVPGVSDNDPKMTGQYGANLRYKMGSAELAGYYIRYHDKLLQVSFRGSTAQAPEAFFVDYGEDRDLFGVSGNVPVTTPMGEVALGAEVSYRPRDSVAIDPTVPAVGHKYALGNYNKGYVEEEKYQGHVTANYLFPPHSPLGRLQSAIGGVDGYLLAEAAMTAYPELKRDGSVPYLLPNYTLPDKYSWGYVVEMATTFPEVWGSPFNMTPLVDFTHDVQGTTPNALPFVEDRMSLALALNFDYQSKYKLGLQYVRYWGGGNNNLMIDRDFVGGSVSMTF